MVLFVEFAGVGMEDICVDDGRSDDAAGTGFVKVESARDIVSCCCLKLGSSDCIMKLTTGIGVLPLAQRYAQPDP